MNTARNSSKCHTGQEENQLCMWFREDTPAQVPSTMSTFDRSTLHGIRFVDHEEDQPS